MFLGEHQIGTLRASVNYTDKLGPWISWQFGEGGPSWSPDLPADTPAKLRALADDAERALALAYQVQPWAPGDCTTNGSGTCPPSVAEP